jgi:hypothetical protein
MMRLNNNPLSDISAIALPPISMFIMHTQARYIERLMGTSNPNLPEELLPFSPMMRPSGL